MASDIRRPIDGQAKFYQGKAAVRPAPETRQTVFTTWPVRSCALGVSIAAG